MSGLAPDLGITVVILSYNEAIHIRRCIERIKPLASRIVLIDSLSTDGTVDIARELGAEVLQRRFTYHADQLRWGLDQADIRTDWILWMSCDEYLQPALMDEIRQRLPTLPASVSAIEYGLRIHFQGRWIRWGGHYDTVQIRLWRTGKANVEPKLMDERIVTESGETIRFAKGDLIDDNLRDIAFWTDKHNGYSTRHMVQFIDREYGITGPRVKEGEGLNRQGRFKRMLRDGIYARSPLYLRAVLYFIYRYILRLGFLDGKQGFVWHTLQGFWHMLLIDVKMGEARKYIAEHGVEAFRRHVAERYGYTLDKPGAER